MTFDQVQSWIGREEVQRDVVDALRARRLHALLDRPHDGLRNGAPLPSGYHWLYCAAITPRSQWGADGHARLGGFLPPLAGARRMWAGGSLRFLQPISIGDDIERRSVVDAIEEKEGRSGRFHLVRITHNIATRHGLAVEEQQHLVYLSATSRRTPAGGSQLTAATDWRESFTPDEVVLFHFSALTMNGHRIHYDQPYATREEGYPGLVVHAPLTALLLLDSATRHGASIRAFTYRAHAPLFCRDTITLAGASAARGTSVWALRPDGGIAMAGTIGDRAEPSRSGNG